MTICSFARDSVVMAGLASFLLGGALHAGVDEEIGLEPSLAKPKLSDLRFCHPDDNMFDISELINYPLGFIPLVIPITEPAIGYGAVGTLVFISENGESSDG